MTVSDKVRESSKKDGTMKHESDMGDLWIPHIFNLEEGIVMGFPKLEVGKSYLVPWKDQVSVGEYIVTAMNDKSYDIIWKNGVKNVLRLECGIHQISVEHDISKLEVLSCDEAWLDKKIDESFFIEGKIEGSLDPSTPTLRSDFTLVDAAHNSVTIAMMAGIHYVGPRIWWNTPVRVRVLRTEDGLETHSGWIEIKKE